MIPISPSREVRRCPEPVNASDTQEKAPPLVAKLGVSGRMRHERTRTIIRWLLIAAFVAAGLFHLLLPAPFLRITPAWVPAPEVVIALTGWCELAGAVGLAVPRLRKAAGVGLALYALCVWPANMKHALDYAAAAGFGPGWFYHAPRLLFQPVIIWACLYAGGVPIRARDRAALPPPPAPAPR
jgi:uncharacterized membrane protein